MHKKAIAAFLVIVVAAASGYSQRWKLVRYELILGAGTTSFFGDIGGGADRNNLFGLKDIRLDATRPSLTLGLRYKFYQNFAGRFTLAYGMGAGTDIGAVNEARGYSFTTHIIEPSVIGEYYFISEDRRLASNAVYNRRGMINNYSRLGAYVFGGLAGIYFSPKLSNVRPGDRLVTNDYSHISAAIPLGLGVKYVISDVWMVGFELGGRLSLSDFVDGYNPPVAGNKAQDIYYFTAFNAVYRIKNDRDNVPLFLKQYMNRRPRSR
ncbi:MAG: hypothetical protein GYA22_14235 [Bacteroidales bacterium]|nr:hypothetical protein [Bacteroidales bacterium]